MSLTNFNTNFNLKCIMKINYKTVFHIKPNSMKIQIVIITQKTLDILKIASHLECQFDKSFRCKRHFLTELQGKKSNTTKTVIV